MHKYVIRFSKKGYIRFTSHLDMMRLFQRCFKRAGIRLAYSQGFHPHPRMSIAQPLSLGFISEGEYMEIDTDAALHPVTDIQEKLDAVMPEGMQILFVKELTGQTKSLAAQIEYAGYEARFCVETSEEKSHSLLEALQASAADWMRQNEIIVKKTQKKSGKEILIDIRPMVYKGIVQVSSSGAKTKDRDETGSPHRAEENQGKKHVYHKYFTLTSVLQTGSTANLNPEVFLKEYLAFAGVTPVEGSVLICRKDLLCMREDKLVSLSEV